MNIPLRSEKSTSGRRMAGARSLWRANGMKEEQFGKPIIAIANSFTQFVPGHVHLHPVGQAVKKKIESLGCFAAEFDTIAIDDGIAMGHEGMLYSLPSRELIANSVEYMVNAHCADALVCIPNCDKIIPGMLMAAMRLNIPTIFVSGGPMEAGVAAGEPDKKYDLVDAMVLAADDSVSDEQVSRVERSACPTCGCCSGMFTANSTNCLTEALGLGLPGHGTLLATHALRNTLFEKAAELIVKLADLYYNEGDGRVLPRNIAGEASFVNAMSLDIAMGGSTNTVLHLLAIAREGEIDFDMKRMDALSRKAPNLCKVSPSSGYHMEDVHRAGGVLNIMAELRRGGLIDDAVMRLDGDESGAAICSLGETLDRYDLCSEAPLSPDQKERRERLYSAAPGGNPCFSLGGQESWYKELDRDRRNGCIRDMEHAYSRDGGLAVLYGNIAEDGAIVKTAGVAESMMRFEGSAVIFDSQDAANEGILNGGVKPGDAVVIRYEGPRGGPGMQEMLYPTSYLKSKHLAESCALITDGRFSGGSSGLSVGHISPEAAAGGALGLLRNGDRILIDIPGRILRAEIDDGELRRRRNEENSSGNVAFTPRGRNRSVSKALRIYAAHALSADKGAVSEI